MTGGKIVKTARALWKCPRCSRVFAKRRQWHSCGVRSVESNFRGKDPALRRVYRRLVAALRGFGPVRFDAVQSSINFVSTHHFGGLAVRRDYLRLGFIADHAIHDPRILRRMRLGAHRVHHRVMLRTPEDVDSQLNDWLHQAYTIETR